MRLFDPANTDYIPAALRQLQQWVNWTPEQSRQGKLTKVPINARTRRHASSTKPSTWATFDAAVANATQWPEQYGIGFVFHDAHIGIDLDHCIDAAGALTPFAAATLTDYQHTYAERSPSGCGIHILTTGIFPALTGIKSPLGEMYTTARFFTVTGNKLIHHPAAIVATETAVLLRTCERIQQHGSTQHRQDTAPPPDVHANATDDSQNPDLLLFETLCDVEPLFRATWEMSRTLTGPKGDSSPSAYLLSLARYAALAEWPDQQIAYLLHAFLRKHHLPPAHAAKITSTIATAKTPNDPTAQERQLEQVLDHGTDTAKHDAVTAQLCGLPVLRIVQMGRDEGVYRLYLQTGYVLDLGNFQKAWAFVTWQRIVFEHTGKTLVMKPARWLKVTRLLQMQVVYEESTDTTLPAETRNWLHDYCVNIDAHPYDYDTLRARLPYQHDGALYVNLDGFLRHVSTAYNTKPTRAALANRLRVLGFEAIEVHAEDERTHRREQRTYFRCRLEHLIPQ